MSVPYYLRLVRGAQTLEITVEAWTDIALRIDRLFGMEDNPLPSLEFGAVTVVLDDDAHAIGDACCDLLCAVAGMSADPLARLPDAYVPDPLVDLLRFVMHAWEREGAGFRVEQVQP